MFEKIEQWLTFLYSAHNFIVDSTYIKLPHCTLSMKLQTALLILMIFVLFSCKTRETAESVIADYQKFDLIILRYSPGDSVLIYPDYYYQLAYPLVTIINPSDTVTIMDHVVVGR
jgi:hypothetical protein